MKFKSKKGQNEENEKKKQFCNSKKRIFFTALFWLVIWLSFKNYL